MIYERVVSPVIVTALYLRGQLVVIYYHTLPLILILCESLHTIGFYSFMPLGF